MFKREVELRGGYSESRQVDAQLKAYALQANQQNIAPERIGIPL
jgi:hypothetical protein